MIDIKLNPIDIIKIKQMNGIFIDSKSKEFIKSLGIKKLRGRNAIIDSVNCCVCIGEHTFDEAEELRKQWSSKNVEWRIISLEELNYMKVIDSTYQIREYISLNKKCLIFNFLCFNYLTRNTCIKNGKVNHLFLRYKNFWSSDKNCKGLAFLVC